MTLTIVFFFSVTLHYLQSKINYNQRIKKKIQAKIMQYNLKKKA